MRDRRQACSALARPIILDSLISGWSISNCTSAVVAGVEPCIGPRRSMQTTSWPLAVSASAIIAPLMPMPTISTSVLMSRVSAPVGIVGRAVGEPDGSASSEVEFAGHENLRRATLNGLARFRFRRSSTGPIRSSPAVRGAPALSITAMPSGTVVEAGNVGKILAAGLVECLAPPRGRSRPASRCSRPRSRD